MAVPPPDGEPPTRLGAFVVVVGPDGVGKTTLAREILSAASVQSGYFHFRPSLRHGLVSRLPDDPTPAPKHHQRPPRLLGWVRLAVAFARFWASYVVVVRPFVRAGGLVVGDRWAYGYLVQPTAVKFGGPPGLARIFLAAVPTPDLVVSLTAPVEEVRRRKQELSEREIAEELEAWSELPAPRSLILDATGAPADLARRVLDEVGL